MITQARSRKVLSLGLLLAVFAFFLLGNLRTYEVYESEVPSSVLSVPGGDSPLFPSPLLDSHSPPPKNPSWLKEETSQQIGDLRLIVEATISGIARKEGKLVFTLPAEARKGKVACPT